MSNHEADKLGRTPLHYACAEGKEADVGRLLASGADPNAADRQGWTPLHFAAQSSRAIIAQALIDAGARVDPRDSFGNTPLAKAVFNSRGDGATITVLRRAGADPLAVNNHGVSPVSLSRTIANFDVRRFFEDVAG